MTPEHLIVPYYTDPLPCDSGPWLIFAPHADDESFGLGGTLLKAAQAGIKTHLVIMTDGSLGGEQENLVAIRQQEANQAAALLGINSVTFLTEKDRSLMPTSFLVEQIVALIRHHQPAAVFFPGVYELHPDHRATTAIVWQALSELNNQSQQQCQAISYEISVQSPVNCLVDISETMHGKRSALNVYLSQLAENNYIDVVMAMNKLRTLTLGPEVIYAEGFYKYSQSDLENSLRQWNAQFNRRLYSNI